MRGDFLREGWAEGTTSRAAKEARSQLWAGNYALSGLGVVGGGGVPRALPRAVAGRSVGVWGGRGGVSGLG